MLDRLGENARNLAINEIERVGDDQQRRERKRACER